MRKGRAPGGHVYWPAFPWPAFSRLSDSDLADLWAWLRGLPPEARPNEPHDITRGRGQARLWKRFVFQPRKVLPDEPDWTASVRRGAYLVHTIGHCDGCHTPRTRLGRVDADHRLAGAAGPPVSAPNLTPHEDGLADWSRDDWVTFLEMGMLPDGDFTGGGMGGIVREGTALLPPEDRAAIADYLMQVDGRPDGAVSP